MLHCDLIGSSSSRSYCPRRIYHNITVRGTCVFRTIECQPQYIVLTSCKYTKPHPSGVLVFVLSVPNHPPYHRYSLVLQHPGSWCGRSRVEEVEDVAPCPAACVRVLCCGLPQTPSLACVEDVVEWRTEAAPCNLPLPWPILVPSTLFIHD
jgi:hypothetical protein